MSEDDPQGTAPKDAKRKRGFWGWLTGEAPEPAPATEPSRDDAAETPDEVAEAAEAVASQAPPAVELTPDVVAPAEPELADEAEPEPVQPPADVLPPVPEPPPSEPAAEVSASDEPAPKKGFWSRLASGLARTASSLGQGITDLVSKRKLDAETLEELEDVLIRADLGVETSMRIVEEVGRGRHDKMIAPEEVKALIAGEVESILAPVAKPLVVDATQKPFIVLMVGVNGSGKTTTIGKLAAQWRDEGRKVVLAAGDTFRAAAIEQLKVWGQRTGATVIAREQGADAAGVAHDAITEARASGADILMIDTAGRLQNRAELMAELEKVVRVIKKLEPTAPHAVLLVLDATVGQNALSQVEAFARTAGVTGLVMTKLDGTARGGILVAIAAKHKLPIHLIGVGEGADDLQPFAARDFARAIAGLN
ncbi:signal recognition particle-docking protein FtsY [Xanthobacter sp. KR7-65]|uniref:signal recognition particle-docking protein FtsY n=1 Tax=Xanthobacter sp. KR7-65 TaxID=3156612 RepID=UPI0032B5E157